MAIRTITALFDDYDAAAKAVDKLEASGVPHGDISIVASNEGDRHAGIVAPGSTSPTDESDAADGAGTGATLGTVLGGGAGLLTGLGLLAIPGVGPVVAAGWLVATLAGAGVGAAAGGLLGALTGAGLSDADAETYAEGVRRGGTLVTVRADDALADRATSILDENGSIDLDERAQNWRSDGWTGGTIGGAHPTPGSLGSTAIGAPGGAIGLDAESGRIRETAAGGTTGSGPGPHQTLGGSR